MKTFECEGCDQKFPISELKTIPVDDCIEPLRLCLWCAVRPRGEEVFGKCKTCGEMTNILVFEFEPNSHLHRECFDCSMKKIGLTGD